MLKQVLWHNSLLGHCKVVLIHPVLLNLLKSEHNMGSTTINIVTMGLVEKAKACAAAWRKATTRDSKWWRETREGTGSRAGRTSILSSTNATSGRQKVLKEPSPGPKLEQFSWGLEGRGSPFSPRTQTPLPWALPLSSVLRPCTVSSSDPTLLHPTPSTQLTWLNFSAPPFAQHLVQSVLIYLLSRQHQNKLIII